MTWDTRSARTEGYVLKTDDGQYIHFSVDNFGQFKRGFHEVTLTDATIFPGMSDGIMRLYGGIHTLHWVKAVRSINTLTTERPVRELPSRFRAGLSTLKGPATSQPEQKDTMTDISNKSVFAPLEAHIRKEEFTDIDLLNLITSFFAISPTAANAMAAHARDFLTENAHQDVTYTDAVVAMYFRTFFCPEHAGLYGTDSMIHTPTALASLVQYIIDPSSVTEVPNVFTPAPKSSH